MRGKIVRITSGECVGMLAVLTGSGYPGSERDPETGLELYEWYAEVPHDRDRGDYVTPGLAEYFGMTSDPHSVFTSLTRWDEPPEWEADRFRENHKDNRCFH